MIREYKLTFILAIYTLTSLLVFSAILLIWTYNTTNNALMEEIEHSFYQRQRTVHSIIDTEYDLIENFGSLITRSEKIGEALFQNDISAVKTIITNIKKNFNKTPDIIFASNFERNKFINISAPIFNTDNILYDIAEYTNELISSSYIKDFYLDNKKIMIILKATEIVHHEKGKLVGYIYTGTVLENNYSLLQSIREQTDSDIVTISTNKRLIATTDKRDSRLTIVTSELPVLNTLKIVKKTNNEEYITLSGNIQKGENEAIFITIGRSSIPLEKLKIVFLQKAIIIIILSLFFLSLSIILLNKVTSIPLKNLVAYSDEVESGQLITSYTRSYIREYNKVGFRMESMVNTINLNADRIKQFSNATWEAIIVHNDGILIEANDQFFDMFGYDQETDKPLLIGTNIVDKLYDKKTSGTIHKQFPNNQIGTFEDEARKKDGTIFPVEVRVRYMDYDNLNVRVAVIRDLTERKKISELMIQTEKMLSVGGLAAGMAHEINNPLAGIIQSADLISLRLGLDVNLPANIKAAENAGTTMDAIRTFMELRGIHKLLKAINDSGARVSTIINNMLSFARKSESNVSVHNLKDLIDITLKLASGNYNLKRQFDFRKINIIKEYPSEPAMVPCEGSQIQQVLLNILRNGADAMQEANTKNPSFTIRILWEIEPNMVGVEIEDNGPGIKQEIRKHIFEPFYTTKPAGVGTGLGLSVSYFIITENHKGKISVESKVNRGTKFTIMLPLEKT